MRRSRAVLSSSEFVNRLRPSGGRRSGKRERIVEIFLQQAGHLSADELVEAVRSQDSRISRATIYRALQWMVEAGIARRVDFGEGRLRFEHAYRHPRHFHLTCERCRQSFEFLSSDVESIVEDVAMARRFAPRESVLQIFGTCEACQAGAEQVTPAIAPTEAVFARDALRMAIATERSGLEFYTRAARITRDRRGRRVFEQLAEEEKSHLATLEARYRELITADPQLEAQPTFLFFKGAANGLFSAGTAELRKGLDDREALLVGIRCERGSHQFFKKYGDRFEESEGKRIFLEFADEERAHFELLTREYRALVARQQRGSRQRRRHSA